MSSSPRMMCQKLGAHSSELTVKLVWSALMVEKLAGGILGSRGVEDGDFLEETLMSSSVPMVLGCPSKISACKDT